MKRKLNTGGLSLLTAAAALLCVVPAHAQKTATYNTDVFDYWHLNGEALQKFLPPVEGKSEEALKDYAYSLALQAAIWGIAPTTFYSWPKA